MQQFLNFIKKEFIHIYRDPRSLIILFGLPVIQILLFGFALTNEIKNVNFSVYDKSKTPASLRLINKLKATEYFTLQQYLTNEKDIDKALISNSVKLVLVIPEDFAQTYVPGFSSKLQILIDASDPNMAGNIRAYFSTILRDFGEEENYELVAKDYLVTSKMLYNPELKSVYMFIPGLMAFILTLISAFMTSITLTREKELGNMEILLISPLKPYQIIIGKVLPYAILSFVNIVNILILSRFVFAVPMKGSLLLLLAESLLFLLNSLSLGILISSFTQSRQVAMMIALAGLLLPTMLLSGFIFPISNMPKALQYFTQLIPATHFIIFLKAIMIKGLDFKMLVRENIILALLSLIFIIISIKKFNVRLDK